MKTNRVLFSFFLLLAASFLPADPAGSAIVTKMDQRMNYDECRMVLTIEDRKAGGTSRSLAARVEYRKDGGTRIEFIEPARDRGKKILMVDTSMWMASPAVSKPVRLSGKDAFMGTSFTNDDMMNMDKSDDYDTVVVAEDAGSWSLVMTALLPSLPYPRIEATVGKDYLPKTMTFFTRSGKESKLVTYSEVKDFGGKARPSVMSIVDLMKPGDESRIVFVEIKEEPVDPSRMNPATFGK